MPVDVPEVKLPETIEMTFADHLSGQLAGHLKQRRVVVWYDERKEFESYVATLAGNPPQNPATVRIGGIESRVFAFTGSMWALRFIVEPSVAAARPEPPVLIYVGGAKRDREASPLLELEKAGISIEWRLRSQGRNALKQRLSDGVIDDLLGRDGLTYADLASLVDQSAHGDQASVLLSIVGERKDAWEILARWIASTEWDKQISERNATDELYRLILAKVGLELAAATPLVDARMRLARYALINEFRNDLNAEPPTSVAQIPQATTRDAVDGCRRLCAMLRREHEDAYEELARRIESEMGLVGAGIQGGALGRLDTFAFEEMTLLRHVDALLVEGKTADAQQLIRERASCFWLKRAVARQAQWNLVGLIAELRAEIATVRTAMGSTPRNPAAWIQAYADTWHRVDWLHRRLEQVCAELPDEPDAMDALTAARADYDGLVTAQNEVFTKVLEAASWSIPAQIQQTRIFANHVEPLNARTAYFLVDALRFEMGADLASRFPNARDLRLVPACAALPSITPVGMAALLPGAAASFDLAEAGDAVVGKVDGSVLKNAAERMAFLKARIADTVDLPLGHVVEAKPARLKRELEGKRLIVVRSQEIDKLGEGDGGLLARQTMDTVVGNLERAIRRLAENGIERFVIAADHGYLFGEERGDDMKMDLPGGRTAGSHRRCWIGEGGSTPGAAIRVSAVRLGYSSTLDLVFPTGAAVFRAPGGLRYHHGGASLQEMVIPVLTMRQSAVPTASAAATVLVSKLPPAITNRIIPLEIKLQADIVAGDTRKVRVFAECAGDRVAEAAMAQDAELDSKTRTITLNAQKTAAVALLLSGNPQGKLRIFITDAESQAVLYQSPELAIQLGI